MIDGVGVKVVCDGGGGHGVIEIRMVMHDDDGGGSVGGDDGVMTMASIR